MMRTRVVRRFGIVALIVVTGCGVEATPTAISLDGVDVSASPLTTRAFSVVSSVPGTTTSTTTSTTSTTSPAPTTTSTTQPSPSSQPPSQPAAWPLALDVVAFIPVAKEHSEGYDRRQFEHWITVGGCSTRESILIRDSTSPAQVDPFGCRVVAGDWVSPYDGAVWESPADVDIDHVVALKEAWDSGAWAWTAGRRRAFANDLSDRRTLRAVTDNVNQAKGDKDPSNWMPPLQSDWCSYLSDWVSIKARWQLSMDESESGRIRNLLTRQCVGLRIEPWSAPPVSTR